ncbi:GreA/GreB family elongation factor [Pedobacter sp. P351]|uniref:GreA/GreB family elongation factor n=1 Tax=Pedobacter superstes TaxID=3133441 RepID=UPI0030B6E603
MKTEKLMLVKRELDLLSRHLKAFTLSDFNKKKLATELETAIIVKDDELPPETVCLDSEVEIRELESGKNFRFQIVIPGEADMQKKRVSVLSPIAIAILGYRTGSKVQWEMPNGVKTFKVLQVKQKEEKNMIF